MTEQQFGYIVAFIALSYKQGHKYGSLDGPLGDADIDGDEW